MWRSLLTAIERKNMINRYTSILFQHYRDLELSQGHTVASARHTRSVIMQTVEESADRH